MRRIEVKNNNDNSFIGAWNINDDKLMDEFVEFFNSNPEIQSSGKLIGGKIDRNIKDSIDIAIEPKMIAKDEKYKIFKVFFDKLIQCYMDYQKQYDTLERFHEINLGTFNLRKYLIGGHFKKMHFERTGLSTSHRLFAWMVYLNDLPGGGGETEFQYFDVKIKPEKGKIIIWPAEWTHLHCGQPTKKEDKYIMTGWFHFPDSEDYNK
mgnify:CR=1 FL=1|tara:strand:- start:16628 stop:17248 length:621 start_codon:yes stop_codon:yes gene_type:complete